MTQRWKRVANVLRGTRVTSISCDKRYALTLYISINTAKAFLQPERPSVEPRSDTSGSDASVQTVRVYPDAVNWTRDLHRNPATVRKAILQQTSAESG